MSYAAVGKDFHDQEDLIGSKYSKLQKLEMVPERWPLARLSFSLQKCVDHLDRVLAGCCWEVQATRVTPTESLLSLHKVAKCLTMQLAVYLAKEVSAILRAVLTHDTKKLYNLQLLDTADLSGITPFIVPIQCYQGRRKKATQQWLGSCCSASSATQKTEALGFWHQLQSLDRWYSYMTATVVMTSAAGIKQKKYPWARFVLDLKKLLLFFDRHLLTCLIANNVQGNPTPHPGTVLLSFLQHLAQLLLLIIALHDVDDAPPFLHHPEIYNLEFWHAHLNYACTRFSTSQVLKDY